MTTKLSLDHESRLTLRAFAILPALRRLYWVPRGAGQPRDVHASPHRWHVSANRPATTPYTSWERPTLADAVDRLRAFDHKLAGPLHHAIESEAVSRGAGQRFQPGRLAAYAFLAFGTWHAERRRQAVRPAGRGGWSGF